jgi:hypothetical protein
VEKFGIFHGHLERIKMAIWYILNPFGNFVAIWHVFPVLVFCVKKNLATLEQCLVLRTGLSSPIRRMHRQTSADRSHEWSTTRRKGRHGQHVVTGVMVITSSRASRPESGVPEPLSLPTTPELF